MTPGRSTTRPTTGSASSTSTRRAFLKAARAGCRRRPARRIVRALLRASPSWPPSTPTTTACRSRPTCPSRSPRPAGRLGQGSDLVGDLPGDSWLAVAQPDLGKTLDQYMERSRALHRRPRRDRAAVHGLRPGSISKEDVLDWMGDFGVFVRGTTRVDARRRAHGGDDATRRRRAAIHDPRSSALRRATGRRGPPARGGGRASPSGQPTMPQPIHVFQRAARSCSPTATTRRGMP